MSDEKPKAPTGADIKEAIERVGKQVAALAIAFEALAETTNRAAGAIAEMNAKLDAIRTAPTGMEPRPASGNAPGAGTGSGMTVKFGRDKGKRLDEVADLGWYRAAIAKSCDDPGKAQWRDRNLDELAEIDREIARRTAGAGQQAIPDAPPVDDRPPPDDDGIPF